VLPPTGVGSTALAELKGRNGKLFVLFVTSETAEYALLHECMNAWVGKCNNVRVLVGRWIDMGREENLEKKAVRTYSVYFQYFFVKNRLKTDPSLVLYISHRAILRYQMGNTIVVYIAIHRSG
jgi:hypothetical protein